MPLLSLQQFSTFLATSSLITLAPGPDILMVLGLGISRGKRQGIAFGLGCAAGCLNHTLLAALGISALVAASPLAFSALKIAGGLYLIWLGIQAFRNARPLSAGVPVETINESSGRLFAKGLFANSINPKVVLFFLAFLPQFVETSRGHAGAQILLLGLVFALQAALIFGTIGWFAGKIGERLLSRPSLAAWLDRLAGGIFMLVGGKLLFSLQGLPRHLQ